MKRRKAKGQRKRRDPCESLSDAQGGFHDARTFLAIAARVLDRIDDSPADPKLRARVSPADVAMILGLALERLDTGIGHLDRGLTDAARRPAAAEEAAAAQTT